MKDFVKVRIDNNNYDIAVKCPKCNNYTAFEVTQETLDKFNKGLLISETNFPELNIDQREVLISGICKDCWNKEFKGSE